MMKTRRRAKQQKPTSLADLPGSLLPQVLAHVPQRQRLWQCALVCRAWASAAALATVHVKKKLNQHAIPAFVAWLQQHAGPLRSLQLSCGFYAEGEFTEILVLPLRQLSQLQQLELVCLRVRVPYDTQDFADSQDDEDEEEEPPLLPCLQQLQLRDVQLASTYSLMQLTDAPNLTSLVLEDVSVGGVLFSREPEDSDNMWESDPPDWDSVQQAARALPRMLQQLPRLSVLELPGMPFTDAAVQALRGLPELRRVTIQHTQGAPKFDLQQLPGSITQLRLHGNGSYPEPASLQPLVTTALPPQLPQLTALLDLHIDWCCVPPAVLGSVTQLQRLHLACCMLLPYEPQAEYDTEGTAALLDILPKLKRLQELDLRCIALDIVTVPPQHFAALTASSQLTRLSIFGAAGNPLPQAAVQHMFPAGKPAPRLQELVISTVTQLAEAGWCLDSAELGAIASGCPGLRHLCVRDVVKPDADLSALLQLPQSCTYLALGAACDAASVLAPLTQLKRLY